MGWLLSFMICFQCGYESIAMALTLGCPNRVDDRVMGMFPTVLISENA